MNRIKSIIVLGSVFLLLATNIIAQDSVIRVAGPTVTMTGKVVSINQKSRKVKLKTDAGKWHIFTASDSVMNLDQIEKGEMVTVVSTEAIVYKVRNHDDQTGETVSNATTVTATITAINPDMPSITFKGPNKETQTIKVKDPQYLKGLKVGNVVDITFTEAMAIKVDKASKK
jgi:hypothetical protein